MPVYWPSDLPQIPQLQGFQMQIGMSVLESDTDKGPPKRRSMSDFTPHPMIFQMVMTVAQWNSLITYFKNDLANGALSFYLTDPLTGTLKTFVFADGPSCVPDDDPAVLRVSLPVKRMD